MEQKDKQLLFKDLCARLHYGVIVDYGYNAFDIHNGNHVKHGSKCILKCYLLDVFMSPRQNEKGEYIKPYLRPMSSMTKEEKEEVLSIIIGKNNKKFHVTKCGYIESNLYSSFKDNHFRIEYVNFSPKTVGIYTDWLNAHHFDYRGLIKKGLAIEVTEENNPYKDYED